jgi:hypothetical protein
MMKVKMETEVQVKYDTKAGELAEFFASLPAEAKVKIRTEKYHDQRDSGGTWFRVTWEEDRPPRNQTKEDTRCVFDEAWIGRCKNEVSGDTRFCWKHLGEKCSDCGKQAFKNCEATIGAFVCGSMLCSQHSHTH